MFFSLSHNNFRNVHVFVLCPNSSDSKWEKVQHECIRCLKAIMNNKVGLKDIFEHKEAVTLIARSLSPSLPHVMLEAVKLMAAICILPPDGHEKVLESITIAGTAYSSSKSSYIIHTISRIFFFSIIFPC